MYVYKLATFELTNIHAYYYGHSAFPNIVYRNATFLKIPLLPLSYKITEITQDFEMLRVKHRKNKIIIIIINK